MSLYSDLSFVHALGDGGARAATRVVVIHATDNTASASAEANYARIRPDKTSAHFYADDSTVIQALDTSRIAYGCLYHGNRISVQFELCGRSNQISDATMRRAAPIVARVCHEFGVPIRTVNGAGVRAGVMGICGHDAITAAFPEDGGDHTDPGSAFPWATFLSYMADPPPPSTTGDDDMPNGELPSGFGIAETNAWIDQKNAVAVPLPAVGSGAGQWGGAWLYLAGAGAATVRYGCFPGGQWADASVTLTNTVGPLALPGGTTQLLIARKRTAADDAADSTPVRWHVQYAA